MSTNNGLVYTDIVQAHRALENRQNYTEHLSYRSTVPVLRPSQTTDKTVVKAAHEAVWNCLHLLMSE